MHSKIRDYVFFKLRNDHSDDHLEKKEEIISNIIARYDELYEKTNDESYAYIEAIKTIGEFSEESKENESYKPEFAEMLLVSATVLSVISLIATLLSGVAGIIIVGTSITLYAVGAVYMYQYSKFVQTEEYDISKYQTFLNKAFSYMKTNFTFWALSLTLIFSRLIYNIILLPATVLTMNDLNIDDIYGIFAFTIIVSLFALGIIGFLFIRLYRRLMKKYSEMTGNKDISSVGSKVKKFINGKDSKHTNVFLSKWFYPVLHGIIICLLIYDIIVISETSVYSWPRYSAFFIVENLILIAIYIILSIFIVKDKMKRHMIVPLSSVFVSITALIIWMLFVSSYSISSVNGPIFFFVGLLFIFLFVVDFNVNRKLK